MNVGWVESSRPTITNWQSPRLQCSMPRPKRRERNVIYQVEFKPRAIKDLKALPSAEHRRVITKLEALQNDLGGDVK